MSEADPPAEKARQWLEVSVWVDDEMAEAVADLLSQHAPGGIALSYAEVLPEADEEGTPHGALKVAAYLPVNEDLEQTQQRVLEGLWHLGQIRPLAPASFRLVADRDWTEEWKRSYRPIPIGEGLLICPSWIDLPAKSGQVVVRLDPGMAFGTGTHPTTRLCLEAVRQLLVPGSEVIDLGCGSGILAIAALRLGASRALALDTDPEAVRTALHNGEQNEVADRLIVQLGSLAEALSGAASVGPAGLVVVNILARVVLDMLRSGLPRLVLPEGRLVLSGILEEQSPPIEKALAEQGFGHVEKHTQEDWVALWASWKKAAVPNLTRARRRREPRAG